MTLRRFAAPAVMLFATLAGLAIFALPGSTPPPTSATATSQPASGPDVATSAPANGLRRVHAFVSGNVQGVGFRDFTLANANRLKLRGWVQNLPDKRVELAAQGPADAIEKLLKIVRVGPSSGRVDRVEVSDEPLTAGELPYPFIRK